MIFPYHNKIQALIRLSLWKPISNCIPGKEKKSRKKDGSTGLNSEKKFLKTTALAFGDQTFESEVTIPDFNESFSKFITLYPNYQSSDMIDQLRDDEYQHLSGSAPKVCLDYCGFGLFSYVQFVNCWESCTFNLSEITANLSNHAFYGCSGEGTVEHDIKTKIMDYLNIPENEYGIVFTVSRGSAFKLLAESYPFGPNRKLLTMFDHESQSVNWMAQSAKEKGAKVERAWFRWPTLRICSTDLRKQLSGKKRWKDSAAGLFVFPVQSRVTGAKYSYQWMGLAQKNNWHVCLDAGSLGPKDMDSLGLSLFRPDFIITSFYRVFGHDPTGFGCLLIKKSVASSLQNYSGYEGTGMVKIRPVFPQYLTDSIDGLQRLTGKHDNEVGGNGDATSESRQGSHMPVFSGAFTSAQVKDVFETEVDDGNGSDRDGASTVCEDTESVLIEEVMKSPVFSEDESPDNSFWINLGRSPILQPDIAPKQKPTSPSPPFWFKGRKSTKGGTPPKLASNTSSSRMDDKEAILVPHDDCNMASYDVTVQSVIEELDCITEATWNTKEGSHHQIVGKMKVEPESREPHPCDDVNGFKPKTSASVFKHRNFGDSSISKSFRENDIRRETEFDLWLLGRRGGKKRGDGRIFDLEEDEQPESYMLEITDLSARSLDDEDCTSVEEYDDRQDLDRREPEMICRHLDHVMMLGLNKTTSRLRFLVNWLVSSLQQLKVPGDGDVEAVPLVIIYGPKIKYERGASVAFNVRDRNRGLISPEVVLKLAEIEGIYLGIGILSHIRISGNPKQQRGSLDLEDTKLCRQLENGSQDEENGGIWVEVVTASLGFLTNFEDVYKLWSFVAKFLNPSFTKTRGLPTVAEGIET